MKTFSNKTSLHYELIHNNKQVKTLFHFTQPNPQQIHTPHTTCTTTITAMPTMSLPSTGAEEVRAQQQKKQKKKMIKYE